MVCAAVAATLLALGPAVSAGEPRATDSGPWGASGRLAPRLWLVLEPSSAQPGLAAVAGSAGGRSPMVCPTGWCQPRVDVPGLSGSHPSPNRPELVASLLDAAKLAPLADLVWLVARTGVSVEWKPPHLGAGIGTGAGGYGDVLLWLKLKLDAFGRPSFPARAPVSAPRA